MVWFSAAERARQTWEADLALLATLITSYVATPKEDIYLEQCRCSPQVGIVACAQMRDADVGCGEL